jgi:hypothetical protein
VERIAKLRKTREEAANLLDTMLKSGRKLRTRSEIVFESI